MSHGIRAAGAPARRSRVHLWDLGWDEQVCGAWGWGPLSELTRRESAVLPAGSVRRWQAAGRPKELT